MFRLGMLALIIAAAVLVLTNPAQEAHRKVVYTTAATDATNSELLGKIAVDVLGQVDVVPLQYNNYYVFSTTTLQGKTESVGALSHTWKWR